MDADFITNTPEDEEHTYWNYRVLVDADGNYSVHEVYYDGEWIIGYIAEPATPFGETLAELSADIQMFKEAALKPALTIDEIEFAISEGAREK